MIATNSTIKYGGTTAVRRLERASFLCLNRIQIYCDDKPLYSYVKFLYRYNDEIKNIEIRINLLHRVKFVAGGFVVRKIIWAYYWHICWNLYVKFTEPENMHYCYFVGTGHTSVFAVCNCLINQLLQLFRLLFGGYCTDNRLSHNITVFIDNISCGVGVQSGCEFSGFTF